MMSDLAGYKRAAAGDIAYNMMRLWQGAVGVPTVDGLVSPAYVVARPFRDTDSRYYAYLFRTDAYMQEVNKYSRGIVSDRNRLYWDDFKQMPSPCPSPDEQRAIVRYLDYQNANIARLISVKRRLIDLLNEQMQAIIHGPVTRGLDRSLPFKPSGVELLNDVPAHWEVKPLKHLARVRLSGVDKHLVEGERPIRLCNYTDVYRNDSITRTMDFMQATATESEIEQFTIQVGDVLITKDSETAEDIAIPALVREETDDVVCGYHLALLRPDSSQVESEYLFWALNDASIAKQFHLAATGVTRFGLSQQDMRDAVLPVPPLAEQEAISRSIRFQTRSISDSISRVNKQIELGREYRTRLIADVVTGKVDVQHFAVEHPSIAVDGRGPLGEAIEMFEEEDLAELDERVAKDGTSAL